jgi:uncharacterized membrane protein YkoI
MRLMPIVLALGFSLGFTAPAAAYVDIETVRAMAFDRGIVKLEEIELKRRKGIWKVEGEDAYGEEIEMEIDARTGRIIKMKRD